MRDICYFLLAALAMLLAVALAAALNPGTLSVRAIAWGCILVTSNALVAFVINRVGLGRSGLRSLLVSGAGHGCRFLLLVAIIWGVMSSRKLHFLSFTVATLVGYCCFLVAEIAALHAASNRLDKQGRDTTLCAPPDYDSRPG